MQTFRIAGSRAPRHRAPRPGAGLWEATPGPIAAGPGLPAPSALPVFGASVTATVPPPPISGGTLLGLQAGSLAVASDPDRDALYVIDTSAGALLKTIALQSGD